MRCGVLLPHFGNRAYLPRLLDSLDAIEAYGYDSVWVRDHFIYRPDSPDDDGTWVDPVVALAAVGARTGRVVLGTAVLIPHRHPVHLATLLSSLATLVGGDRLIVGLGTGSRAQEMAAANLPGNRRGGLLEEQVDILRALWSSRPVNFHGRYYELEQTRIAVDQSIAGTPLWYGGITVRAVERAASRFDGLLLSRLPIPVIAERAARLRRLSAEAGRPTPSVGLVVQASPGWTREEAMRAIDVRRVMDQSAKYLATRAESTAGLLVAGAPSDIAAEVSELKRVGVDHLVLDMRARFPDWEHCLQILGEAVLPELRRAGVLTSKAGGT